MRLLNRQEKLYVKGNQAERSGLSLADFYRRWQRQVTQSNTGAWGGVVALVSWLPQATASTLVRLGAKLGFVEAETIVRRGVAARPPLCRRPTRHLARPSRPALVTTRVGVGPRQGGRDAMAAATVTSAALT